MRHLVVFSNQQIQKLLDGQLKYDFRFFKKKPEFLSKLSVGDVVYFRKRGEVLGQFEVGKIMVIENLEVEDWNLIKDLKNGLSKEIFEIKARENSILLIIQIKSLEQFITSPIELPKNRNEWIVLE